LKKANIRVEAGDCPKLPLWEITLPPPPDGLRAGTVNLREYCFSGVGIKMFKIVKLDEQK
jgi:hypothetical protein